jgi:hypothetical protein
MWSTEHNNDHKKADIDSAGWTRESAYVYILQDDLESDLEFTRR